MIDIHTYLSQGILFLLLEMYCHDDKLQLTMSSKILTLLIKKLIEYQ